jgi:hypothetical protein
MTQVDLVSRVLGELGISREPHPARPGIELRLALEQDDLFGPIIAFSFGAMAMDIWDDVTYRVIPLAVRDAHQMIHEPAASHRLLGGYRDAPAPDLADIEAAILKLSQYAEDHPEFSKIELDPLIACPDGLYARAATVISHRPS